MFMPVCCLSCRRSPEGHREFLDRIWAAFHGAKPPQKLRCRHQQQSRSFGIGSLIWRLRLRFSPHLPVFRGRSDRHRPILFSRWRHHSHHGLQWMDRLPASRGNYPGRKHRHHDYRLFGLANRQYRSQARCSSPLYIQHCRRDLDADPVLPIYIVGGSPNARVARQLR